MADHGDALTVAQVAAQVGVSASTVRRLIWDGELPAWRIGKRGVRVWQSDLDAYLRRDHQR